LTRSAVNTIRGYCYQFDRSILELILLPKNSDFITVESIEDIDRSIDGETTAIQCKYYEGTNYTPSVIGEPIRLMLTHYKENPNFTGKYYLYGHYKNNSDTISNPVALDFLKEKLLTYTKKEKNYLHHKELSLNDQSLEEFTQRLFININAKNLQDQKTEIIEGLSTIFSCEKFESEHYYYSQAVGLINELSCNKSCRKITKQEFITKINKKRILFNIWTCELKGRAKYLSKIKKDFFERDLNTQPFDRFFLLDGSQADISSIKSCIYTIQRKWSVNSARTIEPFSPYIYVFNISEEKLIEIKGQLYDEGLFFSDGYPFRGSKFYPNLLIQGKKNPLIKFQAINKAEDLEMTLKLTERRVEIFQFYVNHTIELNIDIKSIEIQLKDISDLKEVV